MIDARKLHGWLGNKDRFHQWMSRRITEYGFQEPEDFCTTLGKTGGRIEEYGFTEGEDFLPSKVLTGGRPRTDYLLTIDRDGDPWFVAADVCRCLDMNMNILGQANVTVACRKLDETEKGMYPIQTPKGGTQNLRVVSESGLYKLIMRSDKKEARVFQDWE